MRQGAVVAGTMPASSVPPRAQRLLHTSSSICKAMHAASPRCFVAPRGARILYLGASCRKGGREDPKPIVSKSSTAAACPIHCPIQELPSVRYTAGSFCFVGRCTCHTWSHPNRGSFALQAKEEGVVNLVVCLAMFATLCGRKQAAFTGSKVRVPAAWRSLQAVPLLARACPLRELVHDQRARPRYYAGFGMRSQQSTGHCSPPAATAPCAGRSRDLKQPHSGAMRRLHLATGFQQALGSLEYLSYGCRACGPLVSQLVPKAAAAGMNLHRMGAQGATRSLAPCSPSQAHTTSLTHVLQFLQPQGHDSEDPKPNGPEPQTFAKPYCSRFAGTLHGKAS